MSRSIKFFIRNKASQLCQAFCYLSYIQICQDSTDSVVTGYILDDRVIGVQVSVGSRMFSFPRHPNRLWGPPSFQLVLGAHKAICKTLLCILIRKSQNDSYDTDCDIQLYRRKNDHTFSIS